MDDELTALAEAAAAVLVSAMATDLWQGARSSVLGLFRRAGRRRRVAVEGLLDRNAALVRESADPDEARRALLGSWALELAAMLREDPSCLEPLTRLVAGADGAPSHDRRPRAGEQTNTAHDSGTVFAVQYGDQRVYRSAEAEDPAGR
ncbi:hypothetical protein [Streptomyces sp. NPDC097981]|uniref:hypothetical protein n=1 Tax=Streptomyces sp. NPDC097981 TaxID=3155428 RepID=UPI0033227079